MMKENLSRELTELLVLGLYSLTNCKEVVLAVVAILRKEEEREEMQEWITSQVEQDIAPLQHEIVDKAREIAEMN